MHTYIRNVNTLTVILNKGSCCKDRDNFAGSVNRVYFLLSYSVFYLNVSEPDPASSPLLSSIDHWDNCSQLAASLWPRLGKAARKNLSVIKV